MKPVVSDVYDKRYFLEACGGVEYYRAFGPERPKPALTYTLRELAPKAGMRVLDIGCGRGELLYKARQAGAEAVGTDYAEAALELAAEISKCPVLRCDAKALPFLDSTFDQVCFIGVIDHLHDWEGEEAFAEIARVLKPGGRVLVHTCVNRVYYKNLTYGLRLRLVRLLGKLGLRMKEPSKPRTSEDELMHVNEHSYGDLERFFEGIGWRAEVRCLPNNKFLARELFGDPLPEGFPVRPPARWKEWAFLKLAFRFPLNRILAREFFVVARPPR